MGEEEEGGLGRGHFVDGGGGWFGVGGDEKGEGDA